MDVRHLLKPNDDETTCHQLSQYLINNGRNLDLDVLSNWGGIIDVTNAIVENISRNDGIISCSAAVDYTEIQSTGCGDIDMRDNGSCVLAITIDENGNMRFQIEESWDGMERSQ